MRTLIVALCCVSAQAGTILYTDSGTFSGSTPSTVFSRPSETWAFSFQANTDPTPLTDVGMGGFSFTFSDFSYSLDGSPVAITPTLIRFFSATNSGGFGICFSGPLFRRALRDWRPMVPRCTLERLPTRCRYRAPSRRLPARLASFWVLAPTSSQIPPYRPLPSPNHRPY